VIGLLFLLLLLSILWTGVFIGPIPIPFLLALIPTLVVVVGFAAIFVLRKLRARKAAQEIERTLKQQGEEHAKLVRPDLQPEVAQMQSEFSKAVGALKSSKLSRGGADALSVLPWYLIIGPPGVGKSTALVNSGLQFPYLSAGGGVRGVGGTRNCQWWLTNEAVILDTAGRYTTEDEDRDEWFSFLEMLRKTRPRRPINGLLVAVNAAELAQLDEESSAALGQRIRERVDEVMAHLRMRVPVYVMFMKCDLLAGFVEMFGDLSKTERGQIWGFTEAMGSTGDPAEVFRHGFDELLEVLEARALERIAQVRRLEDRERVFQFPAQFEALRKNLTAFIGALFSANVYQDTPLLRGAYFSSATQEGRPIDRVMQAIASKFGVQASLPVTEESPPQPKSYFLSDLFSKVIFPDQGLANRSSKEVSRQKLLSYLYAALGFAFVLVLVVFSTVAYVRNGHLISSTREVVRAMKPGPSDLSSLTPLRVQVQKLLEGQGGSQILSLGMSEGNALIQSAGGLYASRVKAELIQPAFDDITAKLRTFVKRQLGAPQRLTREHLPYLEALKLHLLLAPAQGEPTPDSTQVDWVASTLAESFVTRSGHADDRALAQEDAALFVQLLARDPSLGLTRDTELVKESREILRHLDVADQALYQLLDDAEKACKNDSLTLAEVAGGGVPQMKGVRSVRGAFTKECYDTRISSQLKNGVKISDGWVLGPGSAAGNAALATQQVSSLYFEQYIAEWKRFLESIGFEKPSTSSQLLELLDNLTSGEPTPLARLFAKVAYHTRLSSTLANLGSQAEHLLGGGPAGDHVVTTKDVQSEFEGLTRFALGEKGQASGGGGGPPTPLDKYLQTLRAVVEELRGDAQSPHAIQKAMAQVESQLTGQQLGWWQQPFLKRLLIAPLQVTAVSHLNQEWFDSVYSPFKASLAGRYPFEPRGADATLADVAAYFRPAQGTLWGFYDKNLQTDLQRMGDHFQVANPTAGQIYSGNVLEFLGRAQEVTNALFPPGAPEISAGFAVNVHPSTRLDLMRFKVDGQAVDYRNGPETWTPIKWPEAGQSGASLYVHTPQGGTDEIDGPGEWGLLRLLEQGTLKSREATTFTVVWKFAKLEGKPEVAIEFRPARSQSPFLGAGGAGEKGSLLRPLRAAGINPPAGVDSGPVARAK
jgi:type VI secretion system protein ImpL